MLKALLSYILGASILFGPYSGIPTSSIQPLQLATPNGDRTICTVFSINEAASMWGTAAHCVLAGDDDSSIVVRATKMGGFPVTIVYVDADRDIAVVQSDKSVHAPAIQVGVAPSVGDSVLVYGYMWGVNPTLFKGTVGNLNARGYMIFDMRAGGGHSGSPVLDGDGRVVSILQIASLGFSGGSLYGDLEALLPYWSGQNEKTPVDDAAPSFGAPFSWGCQFECPEAMDAR